VAAVQTFGRLHRAYLSGHRGAGPFGAGRRGRDSFTAQSPTRRGAGLPDAIVDAQQTDSGLHRVAKIGTDGSYVLPGLPVGPYALTIKAKGFGDFRQQGIVLRVGDNLLVNPTLQVGNVSEAI